MSTTFGNGKTSMLKKLKISELSAAVEQIGKTGSYKTICHHLWWQARLFFIQFEVYKIHISWKWDHQVKHLKTITRFPYERAAHYHSLMVHL